MPFDFAVRIICKRSAARRSVEESGIGALFARQNVPGSELPVVPLRNTAGVISIDTPQGQTNDHDERRGEKQAKAWKNELEIDQTLSRQQHEGRSGNGHEAIVKNRPVK